MRAARFPTNPMHIATDQPDRSASGSRCLAKNFLLRGLLLFLACLWCTPSPAADLMEPWDAGLSNLELYASRGNGSSGTDFSTLLGYGLGPHFSVSATLSDNADGSARLGIGAYYSRRLRGGLEMDLFAEAGTQRADEAELDGEGDWLGGFEWSLHRAAVIPYLRTSIYDTPDGNGFHPLLGLMVPAGGRVELHLELSSESPERGAWPVHVAFGPNVRVTETFEILPEISMIREREDGETSWQFTIGLVMDPRILSSGKPR